LHACRSTLEDPLKNNTITLNFTCKGCLTHSYPAKSPFLVLPSILFVLPSDSEASLLESVFRRLAVLVVKKEPEGTKIKLGGRRGA
jgi:hypothetical protein